VALKGGLMFQKVNVPILGVAENMSYFVDPPAEAGDLRLGRGHRTAERLGTVLLGQVPLFPRSARAATAGLPIVVSEPEAAAASSGASPRRCWKCLPRKRQGQCNNRAKLPALTGRPALLTSLNLPAELNDFPSKEPVLASSREFVKQSSLYQEFLAEREEILKHKWLESERLGYDIGFRARAAGLDPQAPRGLARRAPPESLGPRGPRGRRSRPPASRPGPRLARKSLYLISL
jgi:hypothetical protein